MLALRLPLTEVFAKAWTTDATDLFREWRTADKVAYAFEQQLLRRSLDAIEGTCQPPLPEDHDKARRLRQVAKDLFVVAMEEMAAHAKRLDGGVG